MGFIYRRFGVLAPFWYTCLQGSTTLPQGLSHADARFTAAPRYGGRAGPLVVRRIRRKCGCHVRSKDREDPGMEGSHSVECALSGGGGQERRRLDGLDVYRPHYPAKP